MAQMNVARVGVVVGMAVVVETGVAVPMAVGVMAKDIHPGTTTNGVTRAAISPMATQGGRTTDRVGTIMTTEATVVIGGEETREEEMTS